MRRTGTFLLALSLGGALSSWARADEVDDLLARKAHNRDRVQHLRGEFAVETRQPPIVRTPKITHMRFKMNLTRLSAQETKGHTHPWLLEADILEPHEMHLKVQGEQAWFLDHRGNWTELPMTETVRERFGSMTERFLGQDPAEQRKQFTIKVLRHNNPVFGPRTVTVEFVPHNVTKVFSRMEEDLDDDGLPLATRIFGASGTEVTHINVLKHHRASGVPVVDEMEGVSQTPAGEVHSRTTCSGLEVTCTP